MARAFAVLRFTALPASAGVVNSIGKFEAIRSPAPVSSWRGSLQSSRAKSLRVGQVLSAMGKAPIVRVWLRACCGHCRTQSMDESALELCWLADLLTRALPTAPHGLIHARPCLVCPAIGQSAPPAAFPGAVTARHRV
jgi:hypothetical protein